MSENEKRIEEVLQHVDESKRDFVKKVLIGTAFAVPVITSYSMDNFRMGPPEAHAY